MECLYPVVLWCWRIFGGVPTNASLSCTLIQIVSGRYFTMKLCTRIHTPMIRLDSSTRMGSSTPPSKTRRSEFSVQAEGTNVHTVTISRLSSPTGFVPGVISRSGCCISLWRVFLPRSISSPQSTMPVVRRFRKLGTRRAWFGESIYSCEDEVGSM